MPKKRKSRRQRIKEGLTLTRPLKPRDLPVGMYDGMKEALGRPPQVKDLQNINFTAIEEVMRRMVSIRIANWLHTVLITLRDDFNFTQEDLARFSKAFRDRSKTLKDYEDTHGQEDAQDPAG